MSIISVKGLFYIFYMTEIKNVVSNDYMYHLTFKNIDV